jgi:antitoxin component of RelBE/YafQ-DinJ toxin-antitoxin module
MTDDDPQPKIHARIDPEMDRRIDAVAAKYELTRSQAVRLFVDHGLNRVEEDGLDAVAKDDESSEHGALHAGA